MNRHFVFAALALHALVGCAATNVTSVRDPAANGRVFSRVVVWVPFADLARRSEAEGAFVKQLAARGVSATPSIELFPPTREYSGEEIARTLASVNADAVLRVALTDAYSNQAYVPGSSITTGTVTSYGNSASWSATTRQSGGYYVSKPRVEFETRLLDPSNGATLWMSTSLTRGNAFAKFDTLMSSLAREVVYRLDQEQLLASVPARR